MTDTPSREHRDFIRQRIDEDRKNGRFGGELRTRFPPEPNGYLHIGHAKSICLNFGLGQEYGTPVHLRFDDTNPEKENQEFVDSIQADIRWLGFDWGEHLYFASDNFDTLYEDAVALVKKGLAYVDELDAEQMAEYRGTIHSPGKDSPFRDRPVEENLELLEKMKRGEMDEGSAVLRAKIDMAHPNLNMRDPAMYRVRKVHHHRTGDTWSIYPMYDWAHGQCDSYEGITHSLCTLEFEHHRPLYDWFLENLGRHHPQQIEFARLNVNYTVLSKRKLLQLVEGEHVEGWSDPRMPTVSGMRRRGVPAASIRKFCEHIGVARFNAVHDLGLFENFIRDELNESAQRRMGVFDPVELVITDWPEGKVDMVDATNNPQDESAGKRTVPFTGTLLVEREDFREDAPRKWHRLAIGKEVRFRYGYYVTVNEVEKDAEGRVTRLLATHDPESRGGNTPDERKVRGTIHWVSKEHAVRCEALNYDRLFSVENPNEVPEPSADGCEPTWLDNLNPDSLVKGEVFAEPSVLDMPVGAAFQFERKGYYCADSVHSNVGAPVFNLTVRLRDSWAKIEKKLGGG
ncbi:MAG: glutamine--tRNA ligase/YqeY domain fusion protein [Planctomycetota bacterium]